MIASLMTVDPHSRISPPYDQADRQAHDGQAAFAFTLNSSRLQPNTPGMRTIANQRPLFSRTCKPLLPQPLSFHTHTNCRVPTPPDQNLPNSLTTSSFPETVVCSEGAFSPLFAPIWPLIVG